MAMEKGTATDAFVKFLREVEARPGSDSNEPLRSLSIEAETARAMERLKESEAQALEELSQYRWVG